MRVSLGVGDPIDGSMDWRAAKLESQSTCVYSVQDPHPNDGNRTKYLHTHKNKENSGDHTVDERHQQNFGRWTVDGSVVIDSTPESSNLIDFKGWGGGQGNKKQASSPHRSPARLRSQKDQGRLKAGG